MNTKKTKYSDPEIRPAYVGKVVLAFVLATIVFVSIFFLGYMISSTKYQAVIQSQESLRYNLLSFEVERDLMGNSCSNFDAYRFTGEVDDMGRVISLLEERLGKNNPDVLNQKKTYSLLEARHFIYVRDHNLNCNDSIPVILFFYSNQEQYKDGGDQLGYILSSLKNKRPGVMVYSFDYDLDSSLISLLKEKYNVPGPNRLVINEKAYINVFSNVDELLRII